MIWNGRDARGREGHYGGAKLVGNVELLEGGVHDLDDDKGHASIDYRHPEHPAAFELGEKGGEF